VLFDRLIFFDDRLPRSGPANMAMDEVLLSLAAERHLPFLRVDRWIRTGSFRYSQEWHKIHAQVPAGWRRCAGWTGGGAVDHRSGQTYSLMIPPGHELARCRALDSYARIDQRLAESLAEEGFSAEVLPKNHEPTIMPWRHGARWIRPWPW